MPELQATPKKGLKPGTPEGDKLVRVRAMRPVSYGPTAKLQRLYEEGEELVIPCWRFTDFHEAEIIRGITFRGSFELADRPKPISDNVGQHPEDMQELIAQNEDYAKRIADLEAKLGAAPEPLVTVDQKRKRNQEI